MAVRVILKDGAQLIKAIALCGLSQSKFADEVGISACYFSQLIRGERKPSPGMAKRIAEGLGKEMQDLFIVEVRIKRTSEPNSNQKGFKVKGG